jgi:predicted DNA-binding transcriptional regulator YafY
MANREKGFSTLQKRIGDCPFELFNHGALFERLPIFTPSFHIKPDFSAKVDLLHQAIYGRRVTRFAYQDREGAQTVRRVWPLGLAYWGARWSIGAWCELRNEFRNFDVDRMNDVELHEPLPNVEGRRLADFLRVVRTKQRRGRGSLPRR